MLRAAALAAFVVLAATPALAQLPSATVGGVRLLDASRSSSASSVPSSAEVQAAQRAAVGPNGVPAGLPLPASPQNAAGTDATAALAAALVAALGGADSLAAVPEGVTARVPAVVPGEPVRVVPAPTEAAEARRPHVPGEALRMRSAPSARVQPTTGAGAPIVIR